MKGYKNVGLQKPKMPSAHREQKMNTHYFSARQKNIRRSDAKKGKLPSLQGQNI